MFLFSISSLGAVGVDYSGVFGKELYHHRLNKENHVYLLYFFNVNPVIQVGDGLELRTRIEFFNPSQQLQFLDSDFQRKKKIFTFYRPEIESTGFKHFPLSSYIPEFSIFYAAEFWEFQLGRTSYHFGLGITYDSYKEEDYFSYFKNYLNLFSGKWNYKNFYFKHAILSSQPKPELQSELKGLIQVGFKKYDNFKADVLYIFNYKKRNQEQNTLEFYLNYKNFDYEVKASGNYFFQKEKKKGLNQQKFSFVFEGMADILLESNLTSKAGLFSGVVSKNSYLHPNYDLSLLIWNRSFTKSKDYNNFLVTREGRLNNLIYFSPRFYIFHSDGHSLNVAFFTAWDANFEGRRKNKGVELNTSVKYLVRDNLSLLLKLGWIYKWEDFDYGALGRFAITF